MSEKKTASISIFPGSRAPSNTATQDALEKAVTRVAPLWPLENFVAVNPFLGFTDESFSDASRRLRGACDASLHMPRSFYAQALGEGRMELADLQAVLDREAGREGMEISTTVEDLLGHVAAEAPQIEAFPTVADVCGKLGNTDWFAQVTNAISHWAGGYFDAGQASWASPFKDLEPYAAWLREVQIDCSDTVMGLPDAQAIFAKLPEDPTALCDYVLQRLAVPEEQLDLYLHRLLMSIGGWVAHARYRSWQDELAGGEPRWVTDLLAIRLAWELVLLRAYSDRGAELSWRRALGEAAARFDTDNWATEEQRRDDYLHAAYEHAWERQMTASLRSVASDSGARKRPSVQAVFCIDVRSEILRRAIEDSGSDAETYGFAGFFGLPVEYVPLAGESGSAHCPVLLQPALSIREGAADNAAELNNRLSRRIRLRRQLGRGWRAFKNSAVSCFVFVESYGLAYALKLISHTLGLSRPEPLPAYRGLPSHVARKLGPQLVVSDGDGDSVGLDKQIDFAEAMLRGMSMTGNFARLVMLAGHGSATTNNAHGTGLDCGACGGQTGEASARIAALILNNAAVREGLRDRDIHIPQDTHFIAALHTTTTDTVEIFDLASLPVTHREDIQALQLLLTQAGEKARYERAQLLSLPPETQPLKGLLRKSRDWSEVRPEWGLAGCASFVAAPREWTRGLDMGGRSFLHSYDYRQDPEFKTLELIMTAPMVVASWINLQYYGSTVANEVFGSGDKTLHNVVGASIGVIEGNSGDLRTGLPLQSVHNGERFQHEPMRLSVYLAAPIVAINAVLERNPQVRELVENGWLKLFALYDGGKIIARYDGDHQWEPVPAAAA